MRPVSDLEQNALKFWKPELATEEKNSSIIPKLIETQDKFISLLNISDRTPISWKETLLSTQNLTSNLFLKHLIVLSDIGGEKLMRYKRELPNILPDSTLEFVWKGQNHRYRFQTLNRTKNWTNSYLNVDGDNLLNPVILTPMMEDVAMLILFGGLSLTEGLPVDIIDKCVIGNMLGKVEELEAFVKQRYIWVSRITGGATANTLGQLTQNYVRDYLARKLPTWRINKDQLPNVSSNSRTSLPVDIVVKSPRGNFCGVEVSFQVTTNSVIERKAGQAQSRQELLHSKGHKIAYVIDGIGNFVRASALQTIIQYSDCIVTLKDTELDLLVEFLQQMDIE